MPIVKERVGVILTLRHEISHPAVSFQNLTLYRYDFKHLDEGIA